MSEEQMREGEKKKKVIIRWRADSSRTSDHVQEFELDVFGHALLLKVGLFKRVEDTDPSMFITRLGFWMEWKDPEASKCWMLPGNTIKCSGMVRVSHRLKRNCPYLMSNTWFAKVPKAVTTYDIKIRKSELKRPSFVTFILLFMTYGGGYDAFMQCPTRSVRIASPFLNDRTFSDVVVICQDEVFHCHKVILAGASDVFKTMLTGDFIEAKSNRIEISCFKPDVVANLIKFIYEDDVPEKDISWELFEAAKMYDVRGLKKACLFRLQESLDVDNCCRMLEVSSIHALHKHFRLARAFLVENKEEVMKTAGWKRLRKINKPLARGLKRLKQSPPKPSEQK